VPLSTKMVCLSKPKAVSPSLINHAVTFPTAPNVEISKKGDIVVTEVVREGVRKLEAYVEEMSSS
jgi:hypothetical protein